MIGLDTTGTPHYMNDEAGVYWWCSNRFLYQSAGLNEHQSLPKSSQKAKVNCSTLILISDVLQCRYERSRISSYDALFAEKR